MMKLWKMVLAGLILVCCLLFVNEKEAYATPVDVYLDGCGGTFRENSGYDMFNDGVFVEPGSTISSTGYSMQDPTCAGRTFLGWYMYNRDTGAQEGGLMSTADVLNYAIPAYNVRFAAQWNGAPITAITYAALYNATGEPDYNCKITLVNNGVHYSGYGYVTISEALYSAWTGTIDVYYEYPGEFTYANYMWIPDYFDATGLTIPDFIKEGSCYTCMSKTGNEPHTPADRTVVNNFYTNVSNAQPEISKAAVDTSTTYNADSSVVPAGSTISAQIFTSGNIYNKATFVAQDSLGSNNILVFDVTLKDANGANMHQLTDYVEVKMNVPADFTIQNGNTIVVYYLADDGTMTPCDTVYDDSDPGNRFLTFKTNHFSTYVFVEVPEIVETEPETEEETEPVVETEASEETLEEGTESEPVEDAEIMPGKDGGMNPIWFVVIALVVSIATTVIVIVVRTKNLRK